MSATKGSGTFYVGLFGDYVHIYESFFSEQTAIRQLEADASGHDPRSLIIVEWEH